MREKKKRLIPTGECWCGCGEDVPIGAFFKSGHDRRAEAAIMTVMYGSVAQLLDAHGFGPGKRNALREWEAYRRGKVDGSQR